MTIGLRTAHSAYSRLASSDSAFPMADHTALHTRVTGLAQRLMLLMQLRKRGTRSSWRSGSSDRRRCGSSGRRRARPVPLPALIWQMRSAWLPSRPTTGQSMATPVFQAGPDAPDAPCRSLAPFKAAAISACCRCSDSDGDEGAAGSDDEATAAVEFEAATAGQGRKAASGRNSRKQMAAPPKTGVSGTGRPAAAGGRAGGKPPAAAAAAAPLDGSAPAAAPARRHAADPGLQSPTGKRRPGESGLQRGLWVVQYVGFLRHPVHNQHPCTLDAAQI